jgi:hypothetical protein
VARTRLQEHIHSPTLVIMEDEMESGGFMTTSPGTGFSRSEVVEEHHGTLAAGPPVWLVYLMPPRCNDRFRRPMIVHAAVPALL